MTILSAWSLAVLMHWWPWLWPAARRRVSLATSVAALAFLAAALRAEGQRESAMTSMVLVGAAYHTATASADASYYYYVLTATCLLLGFAGLVFGDSLVRRLSERPLATSVAVAWLVTLLRFLLEKSAAPVLLAQAVGITWMAPVAGAYLAMRLRPSARGWRPFLRTLVAYAFLARGFVALVGIVATRCRLGSHYDVSGLTSVSLAFAGSLYRFSPASWSQVLWLSTLPQLVIWPLFTLLAGALGGAVASWLLVPGEGPRRQAGAGAGLPNPG